MAQDRVSAVSEARGAITQYLDDHPDASDSLIGVVQWWLMRDTDVTTLAIIEVALDELIGLGVIECHALPDGGTIFRRAGNR